MTLTAETTWLIAYDVRDPKRLRRMHRFLSDNAVWVQYSVFVARMSAQRLGMLRASLGKLIDADADDVRVYRVPERAEISTLGMQGLPEGVLLLRESASASIVPFTR